jgi:hypothetical protein
LGNEILYQERDGYLAIPAKDFSGLCNDNNHAKFEIESGVPEDIYNIAYLPTWDPQQQECVRSFSSENKIFTNECLVQQSVSRYAEDLFIATYVFEVQN